MVLYACHEPQTRRDYGHHNQALVEYAKSGNTDTIIEYLAQYEQREQQKHIALPR